MDFDSARPLAGCLGPRGHSATWRFKSTSGILSDNSVLSKARQQSPAHNTRVIAVLMLPELPKFIPMRSITRKLKD